MTALDEAFATGRGRGKGCPVCGSKNAAVVAVRLQELSPTGQLAKGGRNVGRGRSYCADHAPELFRRLVEALDQ